VRGCRAEYASWLEIHERANAEHRLAKANLAAAESGFALDVTPVTYQTIELAGLTYRVVQDRGTYLLVEHEGKQFLVPKPKEQTSDGIHTPSPSAQDAPRFKESV
jgi:hypothetical protein